MLLKCKEVSHLVASGAADNLGVFKRWQLRMHLTLCRHCAAYAQQIRALGAGMRKLTRPAEPTNAELERLEDQICNQLGR